MIVKDNTKTSYQERLNRALQYIQENIETKMSLDKIAKEACFSTYHFHRIFSAFIGESIGEYIKRLRLERGAFKLRSTTECITSIALDIGYETPSAFAKAFRNHFKISPLDYRKKDIVPDIIKSSLQNKTKKEYEKMKPDLRKLEEREVVYVRKTGDYANAASSAWEAVCKFAYSRRLVNKDSQMIGISYDDPRITDKNKLRYEACITVDKPVKPEGEVGVQKIKGGNYAVFLHKGPYENFSDTYDMIFSEWLPESGLKLRDCPGFELYLNRNPARTKPENLRTEIFVPIE